MKKLFSMPRLTARDRIRFSLEGCAIAVLAAFLFYRQLLASVPLLLFVPFWVRFRGRQMAAARQRMLRDGFQELLRALTFSFRAGRAAETAFAEAGASIRESLGGQHPLLPEWDAVLAGLRVNIPAETLINAFAERCGIEEIQSFADVFSAAKRSGGDLASLMEAAEKQLSGTIDTEREIETAIAAKQTEHRVMCAMPCGIILYMRAASPGYLDVLYTTLPGILVMTFCLCLYAAAAALGERIVRIDI